MNASFAISIPTALHSRTGKGARTPGGFTLVEILMAISLSALILGAASFFMFSSFNLFTEAQNDPGLEHHKLGVAGFVQNAFDLSLPDTAIPQPPSTAPGGAAATDPTAAAGGGALVSGGLGGSGTTTSRSGATLATTPTSINSTTGGLTAGTTGTTGATTGNTTGNTTSGNTTADTGSTDAISIAKTSQVVWGWPPNPMGPTGSDPYLSFVIPSDNPLLVWDQGPRPPIRAFLSYKDGVGLELIWIPPAVPGDIEMNPIRRTIISPLVTKMTYIYYDPRTSGWQSSDTPPKDPMAINSYILPDFVRLTFNLGGKVSNITLRVPPAQSAVPIY